jgi:transcription elongation factor S-II
LPSHSIYLTQGADELSCQKVDNAHACCQVRTLLFNLKDKKNPDLRRRVLLGEIPPEALLDMSSEELASDAKRADNDKIRAHMKRETERTQHISGNVTDMFKCGKCKKRRCTYYQMQTRSADEPMTTFVRCVECNHRWKFC